MASDGGMFAFGASQFFGSLAGRALGSAVSGISATPDGRGYWMVAGGGGVFAFGDARFAGSPPGSPARLVGITVGG